jgi:hypothetical protein
LNQDKTLTELARRNPFWICSIVFLLLAVNYGLTFSNLLRQRQQLASAQSMQNQNTRALEQSRQLETRLEGLSLELLQIGKTNSNAKQIIQEFNIQWTPAAARPAAAPPQSAK